jgi:hypothetical protein
MYYYFIPEEIDKLKRNLLEAKQSRDKAEHELDTEVF